MNIEFEQKIEKLNRLEKEYRNHKNNFENRLSFMRIVHESKEIDLKELKKTACLFSVAILVCFAIGIFNIYTNMFC